MSPMKVVGDGDNDTRTVTNGYIVEENCDRCVKACLDSDGSILTTLWLLGRDEKNCCHWLKLMLWHNFTLGAHGGCEELVGTSSPLLGLFLLPSSMFVSSKALHGNGEPNPSCWE
ncbi:hypothetical protein LR48_Vigan02g035100 [Vigna angularis]|uniref:Uncharacterized protein n=1 Tax=Phaseolus angularis TaxID=3914 RepID=A0A0L9TUM1_PHAAN|nr:hypothetical protein LR48_Vigan02g035100 [Vigna angularis]